jgi:hypothetical protein
MQHQLAHTKTMQQRISALLGCARLVDVRKPGKWYPSFNGDTIPVPAPLSEGWKD